MSVELHSALIHSGTSSYSHFDSNETLLDHPAGEIRSGIIIALLFFGLFLGWAAFAPLDAAAYAPGALMVSGQRRSVQHRDGGVVKQIFIREGQRVERGQLLIRLAAADVRAGERALTGQAIGLLAQRARLKAEMLGQTRVETPSEFADIVGPRDQQKAENALRLQQSELDARASVLAAQHGALVQRVAQSTEQGQGYSRQVVSIEHQLRLINEELEGLRPLAARGFVSQTRLRQLERAKAELEGQGGQYSASVAQSQELAAEGRLQIVEAQRVYRERAAAELREVQSALGDVLPRLNAARDQLSRTEIRAPATGSIVGLTIFTPGGVIAPGQKLMDIVPESAPLVVEAQVSPDDADDLHIGQSVLIRFPALHERALPNLQGRLTALSADRFLDQRTGQAYYIARAVIPDSQLQMIQELRGNDFSLRAGMPVEMLVPLHERTALEYLLEPLTGIFWRSLHEH